MKFLNEQDREIWEFEAGDDKNKFIQRRQGLISQLKDRHKATSAKHGWKKNRWKHLMAIKRFHKSTAGKRFHRSLGKFLANRIFRKKTSSQEQRENYDFMMALSSAQTHSLLELEYFFPSIMEAAEYEFFTDYLAGEIGQILIEINSESFDFEEHQEFLLRLCETTSLVQSFADRTGKSVEAVEKLWDQAKELAKKEGKDPDSDGYYAYVVGILKKSLGGLE